ncbi:MAG: hypothetical protein ACLFSM_08715 [Thermoplasmata archaeon]
MDDAVSTASEMASALVDWVKDKVSSMFSSVVDPIVEGLENWAETIQTKMDNFFTELSDWEDGDGDVDATMNAGTGLMLSFMGQQDKAEQVKDKTINLIFLVITAQTRLQHEDFPSFL